jgi:NADH-quinone oxidoreductase subunit L
MLEPQQLWLIPALPLLGAALNGFLGRRLGKTGVSAIAVGVCAAAFLWVLKVLGALGQLEGAHTEHVFSWFASGTLSVDVDFMVDRLTAVMLLIITGVGTLIHIYATGYMAEDEEGFPRFFAYLNLFMFFMLTLVLGANFLVMFVGWEGVGLCSYLLIGYYFKEKWAGDAGNKAFIVNRVGDFGFTLAIFLIVIQFGTVDFARVMGLVKAMPVEAQGGILTAIALLLFVGACGKSAQFPLFVWLPDAMAGPTPVSALIHAATMVTAGVYMVARSAPIYDHAPIAGNFVALVGLVTAVLAALIGMAQYDIKKVFAYSTVSQLGYMFIGCGVGAYGAGIYHVWTHAFFKALLFLGAGSVIHALHGEQDMRHMGGLRSKIPTTFWTLCAAWLAISGVPGLSGAMSKDEILLSAYHASPWIFWIGTITAGITAFYVSRAMFMTFWGEYRGHAHPHESGFAMTGPLIILALLSLAGGYLLRIPEYLEPVVGKPHGEHNAALGFVVVAAGLVGIGLAYFATIVNPKLQETWATALAPLTRATDQLFDMVFVNPIMGSSKDFLGDVVDNGVIDGAVRGIGGSVRGFGDLLRRYQTGSIPSYASWVLLGSLVLLIAFQLMGGTR